MTPLLSFQAWLSELVVRFLQNLLTILYIHVDSMIVKVFGAARSFVYRDLIILVIYPIRVEIFNESVPIEHHFSFAFSAL